MHVVCMPALKCTQIIIALSLSRKLKQDLKCFHNGKYLQILLKLLLKSHFIPVSTIAAELL